MESSFDNSFPDHEPPSGCFPIAVGFVAGIGSVYALYQIIEGIIALLP